jgi:hypothetical protein
MKRLHIQLVGYLVWGMDILKITDNINIALETMVHLSGFISFSVYAFITISKINF